MLLSLSSGDGDWDGESVTDSQGEASGEGDESSGGRACVAFERVTASEAHDSSSASSRVPTISISLL